MESVTYTDILLVFALFSTITIVTQYGGQEPISQFVNRIVYTDPNVNLPRIERRNPGPKWIVVTSVQHPTQDIMNLANQTGWNLVVVADTKTPRDWYYPGAHFLSVDKQKELFGDFAEKIPYKSYTRKNLGYLYAIMNGAEWIYDTDDDNKPYGLGLSQFDYEPIIPGLRYISKSANISEKLFNPYRFYGFENMWPRGFPLEYYEDHTNGKDRMISCREVSRPAVQQGIVKADPDVDAIYRLLHAQKEGGLDVSFNSIAPPIVLDAGTYSPWNSQNTLFHYKAFFIMYLPTTVAFRVTDIWRSYFGQKLLHLIGENVAFYPTNAVQIRNAHDYLADFHQEIDVYEQSGKIVEFLDKWKCSKSDTVKCILDLADGFVTNNFFGKADRDLIGEWLKQLSRMGYNFPPLVNEPQPLFLGGKYGNCREANLDLGVDTYRPDKEKEYTWATETVNGFGEILEWCEAATGNNDTFLPSAGEFLHHYRNLTGLQNKNNTVLVFMSNQIWRPATIGMFQRMYSPFFKTTIFCGTWVDPSLDPGLLPPIEPLNFVNIGVEEMRGGAGFGYCVSKVRELRLQNVTGYYFIADDTTFNIWHDLPQEKMLNPQEIVPDRYWWRPEEIQRAYDLFEGKYKNDPRFGKSWQQYNRAIVQQYPGRNVARHFLTRVKKIVADFFFIPSHTMEYIGNLMEVMTEAEVFVEVAFGKAMDGLDYNRGGIFKYLWFGERADQWRPYNDSIIGLHPLKLGGVHYGMELRKMYCKTVVKTFGEEIYGKRK